MLRTYILDESGNPVLEPDVLKWAEWCETASKVVAKTFVGDAEVSTVFLGLDHNWNVDGIPILYETMVFDGVFDGSCDGEQSRYHTREEALVGHEAMVQRVKNSG